MLTQQNFVCMGALRVKITSGILVVDKILESISLLSVLLGRVALGRYFITVQVVNLLPHLPVATRGPRLLATLLFC